MIIRFGELVERRGLRGFGGLSPEQVGLNCSIENVSVLSEIFMN